MAIRLGIISIVISSFLFSVLITGASDVGAGALGEGAG